jgi:Fe-S oxidoreductase
LGRWLNERILGVDARRTPPAWATRTLEQSVASAPEPDVYLFKDTFTNFYHPEVGTAAIALLNSLNLGVALAPNVCCGRPLISQGLLEEARDCAARNVEHLLPAARRQLPIVFCEPSCLSSVKEDLPDLLRGEAKQQALAIAHQCVSLEEFLETRHPGKLRLRAGPKRVLLHGHCHQKSMGLLAPAKALLARIPGAEVIDLDAGCCGMAGSFGYAKDHFEVSQLIAERKLLPAARAMSSDDVLVAAGVSCRHQVHDLASREAIHPAVLLSRLLDSSR